MSDLPDNVNITTSHMHDATEASSCPSCGTPWIWIILFIAALLAIVGLVVWLIWMYHHNSDAKGQEIELKDANIEVTNPTSIKGTWAPLKNSSDKVTLYATLHPPKFNSKGGLDNVSAQKFSQEASSGTTSVSLSGLQPRIKYYATLIATSTKSNNYQVYTQLVYMQDGNISTFATGATGSFNTFSIQDILQVGSVQLVSESETNGIYNVNFNQTPTETRNLFYYNGSGQLQSSDPNFTSDNICLFNSNGNLQAQKCIVGGGDTDKWTYNPSKFANRWCLSKTVGTDNPTCMVLDSISSSGVSTISVKTPTAAGDAWAIGFENKI